MDTITLNGIEYVKKESVNSGVKIAILQRGWVFVGYFERNGNDCKLTNASVIRNWGTTKGIGEITDKPTDKTVLDKCGTVSFDYLTSIAIIDCKEEGWKESL